MTFLRKSQFLRVIWSAHHNFYRLCWHLLLSVELISFWLLTRLPLFLHVSKCFCLLGWILLALKTAATCSVDVSRMRISMPLSVGSSQRVCTSSFQKQSDNLVNLVNQTNLLCYHVHKIQHLFTQNISLHFLGEKGMSTLCGKWGLVPN